MILIGSKVLKKIQQGTDCAVKKQLGSGIPHQALATDVYITCGVKIFWWAGVILKWNSNTDPILPIYVNFD